MTRCEFFTEDDRITGFSISGHSGYAEAGADIVCAAISAVVTMAEATILSFFILYPKILPNATEFCALAALAGLWRDGSWIFVKNIPKKRHFCKKSP